MSNVIKKRGQLQKTKELFAVYHWLLKYDKELLDKHLPNTVNYWTLETCKQEALKYKTKKEWELNSGSSYITAYKNKWLEDCSGHMEGNKSWTLEKCKQEALKYKTRSEWKLNSVSSYLAAQRNKWIDECCTHMGEGKKPKGYWTLETCKQEALKYKTRNEWQINSGSSYGAALRNNWLEECSTHMEEILKPKGYWTLETCKQEALKYKTKSEWILNSGGSYNAANKNKWAEECCAHMESGYKNRSKK